MKSKWLLSYAIVGLLFGIVDWFIQESLGWISKNSNWPDTPLYVPVILFLIYGVWLIPAFFVARHASQVNLKFAAAATALTWVFAVVAYYIVYAGALLFIGLPFMDHLLWQNRHSTTFITDWRSAFNSVLINQVWEWLPIAIIGGLVVGFIFAWFFAHRGKNDDV